MSFFQVSGVSKAYGEGARRTEVLTDIDLEVDGGVNEATAAQVIAAGADVLVAGSAVFRDGPANYAANIQRLRVAGAPVARRAGGEA